MQQLFATLFFVVYSLTILGIAAVIISDNRNPLKTLPWILVLLFAPGVGLFVYFFFGQDLSKRKIISRRTRKRITTQLREESHEGLPVLPERHRPLVRLLSRTAHAVPLYGSRLTPYVDGKSKMEALLADIAAARHHIHLQYYIFSDDATGTRLRDALVAKARQGVRIRILYDDVGCARVRKSFFDSMRTEGIEVRSFLHVQFPRFTSKVNYRNHRKIVVVDGRVGFIGGMNVADRYLLGIDRGAGRREPWRDTHFRVEGPGVAGLQASFLSDWSATTKQHLEDPALFPPVERLSDGILQLLPSGPFGKWRSLLFADSYAISRASKRIWIETPYYLPSETLNAALQEAALAGVDVRLMLPERSDSRIVDLASHSYLSDMVQAGVKIAFYLPGFLHSKLLIIDDDLVVIGSANMDFRSFEHNFEVNAFVYDPDFNARMAGIFEHDTTSCRLLDPASWFGRPRIRRFAESFVRIFSPLL